MTLSWQPGRDANWERKCRWKLSGKHVWGNNVREYCPWAKRLWNLPTPHAGLGCYQFSQLSQGRIEHFRFRRAGDSHLPPVLPSHPCIAESYIVSYSIQVSHYTLAYVIGGSDSLFLLKWWHSPRELCHKLRMRPILGHVCVILRCDRTWYRRISNDSRDAK